MSDRKDLAWARSMRLLYPSRVLKSELPGCGARSAPVVQFYPIPRRLSPARMPRRSAWRAEDAAPVPLYHPPRHRPRAPCSQPCRATRAYPEDRLSRGHDPHRHVTPGVFAATRRPGSPSTAPSHPLPWRARTPREAPSRGHSGRAGQRPYPSADHAEAPPAAALARLSWARLLKRVFDIDIEQCPHCGGPLTIIAAIVDPAVIAKILKHLGMSAGTAPSAGAALRPIPNRLIRIPPRFISPSRPSPLACAHPETPKPSEP